MNHILASSHSEGMYTGREARQDSPTYDREVYRGAESGDSVDESSRATRVQQQGEWGQLGLETTTTIEAQRENGYIRAYVEY